MIGMGLKKLAQKYGMTVSGGIAYGAMEGFAVTLSEGMGYKRLDIVTKFTEPGQREIFLNQISQEGVEKEYRIQKILLKSKNIEILFTDSIGTMKRIEAFIAWFFPQLAQSGASPVEICIECGQPVSPAGWYKINGLVFQLHDACAQQINRDMEEKAQQRKDADTGSYISGTFGALIGALLGAVVWAIVLALGYITSIGGLLIGWLAERGYALAKGKQGKGKFVILILAIVFGVLLGTFLPDVVDLARAISEGELPWYSYGDIPALILEAMEYSSEYAEAVLSNAGMGLLFAALGAFVLLRRTKQEVTNPTLKKLN